MELPNFLTAKELAAKLRVLPRTVRLWAAEGRIPVLRASKRRLLFDPAAVEAALRQR